MRDSASSSTIVTVYKSGMEIEYTTTFRRSRLDLLDGFFESWPARPTPVVLLRLLQSSDIAFLARDSDAGGRVVGFATAITDGSVGAFIPLLEVLPGYRGRGIGTELMRRVLRELDGMYGVDLVCDPELVPFYERLGMQRAVAMVVRRPDRLVRLASTEVGVTAASKDDAGVIVEPATDDAGASLEPTTDAPDDGIPPWLQPPAGALPTPVAIPPIVLHRDDQVIVWASDFEAADEGFSLAIHVQTVRNARLIEAFSWELREGRYRRTAMHAPHREIVRSDVPDEAFRCGIRFSDGTSADSLTPSRWDRPRPPGPVVSRYGGGGGTRRFDQTLWVWPRPPDGPLTIWCEWPDGGVPRTEAAIDGRAIRTAYASRSEDD